MIPPEAVNADLDPIEQSEVARDHLGAALWPRGL